MATTVFTLDNQGAVAVLSGDQGAPSRVGLSIPNWPGTGSGTAGWPGTAAAGEWNGNVIITGISLRTQANAQFVYTLRNNIYVYVFGEQLGDFSITGIAPSNSCGAGNALHNIGAIHDYYGNNALSMGVVTTLSIFTYSTKAYLVGMQMEYSKLSSNIGTYTLAFKTVPPTAYV